MRGRFEKAKPKRKKNVVLIVLGIIVALLLALVIGAVIYYFSMVNKMNIVNVPTIDYAALDAQMADETEEFTMPPAATETVPEVTTEPTIAPTTEPHVASSADYLNILLVGQDARPGEDSRLADTMLLCTINTYEKKITLTSMLRDTLVKMPDYKGHYGGNIKLTTIYNLGYIFGDGVAGSMEMMNMTLYSNFGIEVDHNFEVGFDAFIQAIDALGGIDIELTQAESENLNAVDLSWGLLRTTPGMNHLDGKTALSYCRIRHAAGDNDSDIKRTSRQRLLIEAVLDKVKTMNPADLQSLANEILPMVSTSMSPTEFTNLLLTLLPMLPDLEIVSSGTCPAEGEYWGDMLDIYSNGVQHSILRFTPSQTKKTMRAITEGEGINDVNP